MARFTVLASLIFTSMMAGGGAVEAPDCTTGNEPSCSGTDSSVLLQNRVNVVVSEQESADADVDVVGFDEDTTSDDADVDADADEDTTDDEDTKLETPSLLENEID